MHTAPENPRTSTSFLNEMIHRLGARTSLVVNMDVELNEVPFHVTAKGDAAVISFDRFSDAWKILPDLIPNSKDRQKSFEMLGTIARKLGLTICIQYRHFGVLGPRENPLYHKLFVLLTR